MARISDYKLYGNGRKAWRCRDLELMLVGGANTGKTLCNMMFAHVFAQKYPGSRILFVRKSLADLVRNAVATYEKVILPCPLDDPSCPVILKTTKEGSSYYLYKETGSEIHRGGIKDSGSILSGEYDLIIVIQAEQIDEDDWEVFLTRLGRGAGANAPYAQIRGDANPHILGMMHWIMRRKGMTLYKFFREDNPALYNQETGEITKLGIQTEDFLDRLTGTRRKHLREGEWTGSDRMVFPEYNDDIHVIDLEFLQRLDVKFEKWYLGMDWGYSIDPGSLTLYGLTEPSTPDFFDEKALSQEFSIQPEDLDEILGSLFELPCLVAMRQTYRLGELTPFWRRRAIAYDRWVRRYFGGYVHKMICDKSRPDNIEEMRLGELPAVKTDGAQGSIRENINAIQTRLERNTLFFLRNNLDGRDEILESQYKPLCTADEMPHYENPKPKKLARKLPDPVGANHGIDELGYICRDLHNFLDNTAVEVDVFSGQQVLDTRLSIEKPPPPARWRGYIN